MCRRVVSCAVQQPADNDGEEAAEDRNIGSKEGAISKHLSKVKASTALLKSQKSCEDIPFMQATISKIGQLADGVEGGSEEGFIALLSDLPLTNLKNLVGASKQTRHSEKLGAILAKQLFANEVRFATSLQDTARNFGRASGHQLPPLHHEVCQQHRAVGPRPV